MREEKIRMVRSEKGQQCDLTSVVHPPRHFLPYFPTFQVLLIFPLSLPACDPNLPPPSLVSSSPPPFQTPKMGIGKPRQRRLSELNQAGIY